MALSEKQDRLYWRLYGQASRILRNAGYDQAELDEWRRGITRDATGGRTDSHKDLNRTSEFDEVLSAYLAIVNADDLDAQLDLARQPEKRLIWAIASIGLPDPYLDAIARRQFAVSSWRDLSAHALQKLRYTATRAAQRRKKKDQQP